jgi:hypothetical protein
MYLQVYHGYDRIVVEITYRYGCRLGDDHTVAELTSTYGSRSENSLFDLTNTINMQLQFEIAYFILYT